MAKREDAAGDPAAQGGEPATAKRAGKPLKDMTPAEREETLLRMRTLGAQLKPMWQDVASEPLPDDFMKLLDKMAPEDGQGGPQ
ncbi:MAG: hypothetical protein JNM47_17410 [Hyphomonadaceae bacterium]|nr:hypothetical protein [Hyphomonadaceae bacterium]